MTGVREGARLPPAVGSDSLGCRAGLEREL